MSVLLVVLVCVALPSCMALDSYKSNRRAEAKRHEYNRYLNSIGVASYL